MSARTLIRGGAVLTLGARSANLTAGDVLIEDGRITEVGTGLRARDAEVVDATDAIVMPGFVDAHRHTWRTLFRHAGEDVALPGALGAEELYASLLLGLVSAAEAGITTVADWMDLPLDASTAEAVLQAYADAGVRVVLAYSAPSDGGLDLAAMRELVTARAGADPMVSLAAGGRQRVAAADAVAAEWAAARGMGLRVHAHAGLRDDERGAVAALGARGLLGADVTLVHGTRLDAPDFDAIAQHGTGVVLTPCTEMARGAGLAPMQQLIDRNIRPGLGVDDELLAPGDVFTQMRAAQSVQHATLFDLKLAGKGGVPNLLSTRDAIRYATVDGARALGLGELTGSLEPGRQADVLVLRTDRANISPVNDPIGAVVWGMDPANVDWVFAGGRALMRDGAPTADVARVRALGTQARDRLAGVGAGADSGGGV